MQIGRRLLAGDHMREGFTDRRTEFEAVAVSSHTGVVSRNIRFRSDKRMPIIGDRVHGCPTTNEPAILRRRNALEEQSFDPQSGGVVELFAVMVDVQRFDLLGKPETDKQLPPAYLTGVEADLRVGKPGKRIRVEGYLQDDVDLPTPAE